MSNPIECDRGWRSFLGPSQRLLEVNVLQKQQTDVAKLSTTLTRRPGHWCPVCGARAGACALVKLCTTRPVGTEANGTNLPGTRDGHVVFVVVVVALAGV